MTTDLEDYEAAYERVERQLQLERDWGLTEKRIRRRLHRPTWLLVRTLLLLGIAIGAGLAGIGVGWTLAIGLSLAVLPKRISQLRARRRTLAAVETAADVRALCEKESRLLMSETFLRALIAGSMGLLFLIVGLVALGLGKSPWPGVLAGVLALAWSAVQFFVLFPRACREAELFEEAAPRGAEAVDGD